MLRLESPAVDGKSCASVCTRYRTDYRFRYCGVATRILQSAPTPASPVAPRGLCAERQRESGRELARSLGIFSSQRQTNKQCCKRARRFRILETSHLRGNASRAREANGHASVVSVRQCMRHVQLHQSDLPSTRCTED